MVPFYNAFIDGINYGRFIDNTYQTTDCENMVAGDATCGGKAYDAWLMSSDELYNTCMSDQEPSSSAVALDSAWCDASSDDCSKDMCQKGMQYDYYAYNLTNPEEVLKGAKPIVQELTPVHTAMSITKNESSVDTDLWDKEGIAHWEEKDEYVFFKDDETDLMNRKVTVGNFALLSNLEVADMFLNPIEMIETVGGIMAYHVMSNNFVDGYGNLSATTREAIEKEYKTPVSAIKDQYFEGGLAKALGAANGDSGELSLQPFADLFGTRSDMVLPTVMGSDYFGFAFGCPAKQDRSTGSCHLDSSNEDDESLAESIDSTFSTGAKKALWNLIYGTEISDTKSVLTALLQLKMMVKPNELKAFLTQMRYAGSYALYNLPWLRHSLLPVTDPSSDKYDSDYDYYPRFVKLTVGELLGFQDQSKVDKVTGMPLTMALSATTNPVTEQYRASFVEDWKGLYYFKMSNGLEYNCAFDPDCMAQDEFKANGTCTPDDKCHPNYAAGFDVKYVPGTLNGHGTNDYHKVGAIDKMFVSPVFSTAQMKLSKKDQDYNGANIDIWDLADLAFRNENCDGSGDDSRGIDCDSPYLTLNLGTFSSPKPNLVRTPIYASLPHFYQVDGSSSVKNWYPGDRVDTKSCSGSEECDDPERDFNCQMWTEPITGALLKGALKLQMNVMMPPAANTESGKLTDEVLIPAVWVDEHQLAYPYQIDSIKQLQAAPGLFELVMWLGIAFGIVFVLCAVAFFYFGWRRRSALRAVVLQKKVSGVTEAL
ncbi:hypothetical protein Pmar_PMAR023527 [Perkinsus marinus ATCC 50983]|uniref:Uncharacterized protein n=1 Tax=Perkinsus marinus (strain ATCC 50983 / TXsc) TaxID=423536 RepID=C5KCL1_PERM5|nr:hypothetical protein Pmar_PMAR023527 [Perkinsus marinus ATCC 50983]EER17610.1 hypothetical protein Pmar_PMAR023527 [Perkinsus marinus ATCC 50983]|eukprot:XP_002785814.1 hypothetical protein Pmar_PMAR023527 [Perkinsus marinus ATCC 50983]